MKITIKNTSLNFSTRIKKDLFERKTSMVLNTIVRPQIQNARTQSLQLNEVQKAHQNCNGHI